MARDTSIPAAPLAIVAGGGFGGLAAALRLRARGYDVHLIDRCDRLGGRAQVIELEGFRHDTGPTVLTNPQLFEELFALFGKALTDYVTLVAPDPWYRFHFEDAETFDYGPTQSRTEAEIARLSPSDLDGYRRFAKWSELLYRTSFAGLAAQPMHSPAFAARKLPTVLRIRGWESVWKMLSRFIRDDRLRQAFSVQSLLVGGNPFDTTAIYGLIHHLEQNGGIWFPKGGTGALVDALARLMQEEGIAVTLGRTIERIVVSNGRASGVVLDGGEIVTADIVVSNMDPLHVYRDLLPQGSMDRVAAAQLRNAKLSMGLYVLFFGARRTWPSVAHHTILFGERYRESLSQIFHDKAVGQDLSLYLHRPTATDPSFAPPGCDSFYVLCPVPNLSGGQDWTVEAPALRDRIVAKLDSTLLPGLKDAIVAEVAMTPQDFKDRYLSVDGAAFSLSPFFMQTGWFRFHNRPGGVKGLYFVGSGTHPGAGVPAVVSSAKILDRIVPAPEMMA